MFCKNCGKQIPDDARFCTGCGQAVESSSAEQPAPQPAKKEQGNKKLMLVIIAIAAVFLIVAVVFGVLILGKLGNDDSKDKDAVRTEETADAADEADKAAAADDAEVSQTAETEDASKEDAAAEDAAAEEATEEDAEIDEASAEDAAAADESEDGTGSRRAYLEERFPKLIEGYLQPKSDKTFWIPVDEESRAKLDALDNDYNKVAWTVEYAFRQLPALIVSFTVNENCGVPYIFMAFTNIGDKPLSVDGTVALYDFDNVRLDGTGYPYIGLLQPGGTYISPIAAPGIDEQNVDVGYDELNMDYPAGKYGTYSYTASLGDSTSSNITTSISVENTCESKENMGQVTVLLLDENGMPVANGYVFSATSTNPGETMDADVQIGILEEDIEKIEDIAVFASPYITG